MAELVASQLRRRIIGGDLGDGDELPREAELLDEFGVSRPSLREALRILETEGLIRIRRGKVGGAIVQRPTAESTAYHVGLTLQSRGATQVKQAFIDAVLLEEGPPKALVRRCTVASERDSIAKARLCSVGHKLQREYLAKCDVARDKVGAKLDGLSVVNFRVVKIFFFA